MAKKLNILFLSLLLCALPAFAAQNNAFTKLEAGVLLMRGTVPMPAQTEEQPLQAGDIIKTADLSSADFALGGVAGVRMLEASECAIKSSDEKMIQIEVKSGNVIVNVSKLPSDVKFQVETPTAIAAVRGTQFWGRVETKGASAVTTFAVRDGAIEVYAKSIKKSFILSKGQALDIPTDASVKLVVRKALAAEMDAMAQASSIKTSA